MEILSIIPARGGSKGIKRKNLKPILDKPLVAYTIEASLKSKYITKTIVSSEDDEILEVTPKSMRIRKIILDHNMRLREKGKILRGEI